MPTPTPTPKPRPTPVQMPQPSSVPAPAPAPHGLVQGLEREAAPYRRTLVDVGVKTDDGIKWTARPYKHSPMQNMAHTNIA